MRKVFPSESALLSRGFLVTYGLAKGTPLTYNEDGERVYFYVEDGQPMEMPKAIFSRVADDVDENIIKKFGFRSAIHAGEPN